MPATRQRPTKRRRSRGAQRTTREAILDRAVDLASEEGLEGLTIGRLASEMEMSKSGLFGHFGSKEELQLATVDAAAQRFVDEIVAPVMERRPGVDRIHALTEHHLEYLERQVFPGGCFFAAAAAEFDARPGPVRDAVRDRVAAWLELLESEARTAGFEDPAQTAFELHFIAQGANSAFQLFGSRESFAQARAAIDRVLAETG